MKTAKAPSQSQTIPHGTCGGQSGTDRGVLGFCHCCILLHLLGTLYKTERAVFKSVYMLDYGWQLYATFCALVQALYQLQ